MLNTHHKNSRGRLVDTFSGIVQIPVDSMHLEAEWIMPPNVSGVVIFAHGSGSSRHSRRNQFVASVLHESGIGTVLLDLLTRQEERRDAADGQLRFDIEMLTNRLITAVRWVEDHPAAHDQPIGLFGASTGAAAAIAAASILGERISAVHADLFPMAAAILRLAIPRFDRGEGKPAETALPIYLRDKVALKTSERK